jgi:CRP/FNR family transcriptional regulator, cyclic AMP receptor protein
MAPPSEANVLGRDDVREAIAASNLRDLHSAVLAELTRDARRIHVVAGTTVHHEGDADPHFELLVTGFARVYVTAPDGRTMTVRYCRPGAIVGAVSLYAAGFSLPATIEALIDTELLLLDPAVVRRVVERDPAAAKAVLIELSERVMAFIVEIPGSAFATVRQRVARHLLDLASESRAGSDLVAHVTQQELADAGGTVREVVVRILRDLRAEGIVRTRRDEIAILDPQRLLDETFGPSGAPTPGSGT